MRNISLVQSATSCKPANRFDRTTRDSPEIVSAEMGFLLCGIAEEPFWPGAKPSAPRSPRFAANVATRRQRVHNLMRSMHTPTETRHDDHGNDLCGGNRFEFEGLPHMSLHLRRNIRVRSNRSRQLHPRQSHHERPEVDGDLGQTATPTTQPSLKRCRLRMNTMSSTDHHRFTVGLRSRHKLIDEFINCRKQKICGVTHRPAQTGVDNIGGCQTVMDPGSGGTADRLLHDIDERATSCWVISSRAITDATKPSSTVGRMTGRPRHRGNNSESRMRLGCQQLDLKPTAHCAIRQTTPEPSRESDTGRS